jgi:hypothetical protein
MVICTNCKRMYADSSVVRTDSTPLDFDAKEWKDAEHRPGKHMFLYGPDKPVFPVNPKHMCNPSNDLKTGRVCTLVDLEHMELAPPKPSTPQTTLVQTQVVATILITQPVHQKPTWTFPNPLPAVHNAITYATGECQICKKSNWHTLAESPRSRWAAVTIHAYLTKIGIPANPGFMVGVLVHDEDKLVCVAYSSNSPSDNAYSNLNGCKFTGYKLKLYDNDGFANISRSRGGKDITQYYGLSLVNVGSSGVRSSATCAASKLAKKYIGKGKPLNKWNMTEIAYGTMTGYVDGHAAQSCIGCQSFLPTLLCYESD